MRPTPKAFSAQRSITSESLPPENSRVGRAFMVCSSSGGLFQRAGFADGLDVQAAFLGALLLPPPAAGAEVFADADGAGAGLAADAGEELVVQGSQPMLVLGNEMPYVAPGPFDDGADLHAARFLHDVGHFGAGVGLLAPQTGDPAVLAGEGASERFHLSDVAALLAQLDAVVHGFFAMVANELDHRFVLRAVDLDAAGVALLDQTDQGQGFDVQLARVEHENAGGDASEVDQVGDDDVFGAQAGGLGQRGVLRSGALQQRDAVRDLGIKVGRGLVVEVDGAHG